jgi:hypothetical protein
METWDAITSRRNVPDYSDQPVPAADLERILARSPLRRPLDEVVHDGRW